MQEYETRMLQLSFDETETALYELQKIEINKAVRADFSTARKNAKGTKCFICKKLCSSFCNSHSVPELFLKIIAQKGKVFLSGLQKEFPLLNDDLGLNQAGTFHIICRTCDSKYFQAYEKVEAYQSTPSAKLIAQIAMKNALHQIATKKEELETYKLFEQKRYPSHLYPYENLNAIPADISESIEAFRYAKIAVEKNKDDRFNVFFYQKLEYVVPMAFQDNIAIICDFDGNTINNVYDFSTSNKLQYIQIAVFPLKNCSVVIAFTDTRNKKYNSFISHFNSLSLEEQLSTINYIIFSYSENVFLSKTLEHTVLEDRNFLNCCQKTTNPIIQQGKEDALDVAKRYFALSKRHEIPNLLSPKYALQTEQ